MKPAIGAVESGVARAAVIGAGAMGAGIAAQFANAGIAVDLLDVAGADAACGPAQAGIARQLKLGGFMSPEAAQLVRPGNLRDDLGRLADADWIVEAVIEDPAIKRDLYARIQAVRRPGAILSSNTSTLPRAALVEGLPADFARDFIISHFFNPPRVMRLVELVTAPENPPGLVARARAAAQAVLGKTVVHCRDTPGFIANRIGCFWMAAGVLEAARLGLTVEQADAVNAALGIPRTGVFGLFDLVGIDLIPHVWGSLMVALPPGDHFHAFDLPGWPVARRLIAAGHFGRKAGAGFYRRSPDGGREALDLATGRYRPQVPVTVADLPALLDDPGPSGRYAQTLLAHVIAYAAEHGPEIADDVAAIDTAIQLGYSWREGPFRLADRLGPARIAEALAAMDRPVPPLLAGACDGFYRGGPRLTTGQGVAAPAAPSLLQGATTILGNDAARLAQLDDGVACFQITRKMNALSPEVFDSLERALARAGRDFEALVLGNDDPRAFSAGADLAMILRLAEARDWAAIESFLRRGQQLFLAMKYAPVPVVAAAHGFALGGGCELMLHADQVIAHAELRAGLPETGVGLIPAWGGCAQLAMRAAEDGHDLPLAAFDLIRGAGSSASAAEARHLGLLRAGDDIVMNRGDLLAAARDRASALARTYRPPRPAQVALAGPAGAEALMDRLASEDPTPTDRRIAARLARVLTGGARKSESEQDLMALELGAFMEQVREPESQARIAHFLKTGKPLRN